MSYNGWKENSQALMRGSPLFRLIEITSINVIRILNNTDLSLMNGIKSKQRKIDIAVLKYTLNVIFPTMIVKCNV